MNFVIIFFLYIVSLSAEDLKTCYSVQLLSFPSAQAKTLTKIPEGCQIITIGKNSSIRCGCKKEFKNIQEDLAEFKKNYSNAILVNTYKYRFDSSQNTHPKNLTKFYNEIDWSKYNVELLKKDISKKLYGDNINLIPVNRLYFLAKENMYEFKNIWNNAGILWPKFIVLGYGRYDIDKLYKSINDKNIIEKVAQNSYIIKRPIYISASASLLINNVTLRLSNAHGAYISYHGNLDIVDATVTSWNIEKSNYGPREKMDKNELLFYLKQEPRPFLLGLEGSFTKIINSDIIGLGYKGQSGTFGISFLKSTQQIQSYNLKKVFRKRKKPEALLVGNNISKCFFGFYTNNANNIILAGNTLHDNIMYNFDPHDFSGGLIVARNLSYNAVYAHGIIFSKKVKHSIIAENIVFANYGSGIMLDRTSESNLIYKNLSFENRSNGVAIYESSKNIISKNIIFRNNNNGISIRNSRKIRIEDNLIYRNGNNGAEVSTVNIDALETRNFELDPYEKSTQASFIENHFEKNVNSALSLKNGASLFFKNNTLTNSGPLFFSGEIEDFTEDILKKNENSGFSYKYKVEKK
ncbi:MAG: hypothetical protein DRG78_03570 [Epsilonproteobacteria bacterium]|nr:MAG: hypothetical protein DRG78_03570 [Campylobacterota bacterium]